MKTQAFFPGFSRAQLKRFQKLSGLARKIAEYGIQRHMEACEKADTQCSNDAVKEIIDDALNGRNISLQNALEIAERRTLTPKEHWRGSFANLCVHAALE